MQYTPFDIIPASRPNPWVITCDHASNNVPEWINGGSLGLPAEDMARHIAFDPGAAGLSRALAQRLGGTAILSNFSRLVIDPNRGEDDPTLIMKLYDGSIIPANRNLTETDRAARLNELYRPYHTALSGLMTQTNAPVLCAIHSFTQQLKGRAPRPWQIGLLFAGDTRLAKPLARLLENDKAFVEWAEGVSASPFCIGLNEPYSGALQGDSVDRHALQKGRQNILIELRNDLIATPEAQETCADLLAPLLDHALALAETTA